MLCRTTNCIDEVRSLLPDTVQSARDSEQCCRELSVPDESNHHRYHRASTCTTPMPAPDTPHSVQHSTGPADVAGMQRTFQTIKTDQQPSKHEFAEDRLKYCLPSVRQHTMLPDYPWSMQPLFFSEFNAICREGLPGNTGRGQQ